MSSEKLGEQRRIVLSTPEDVIEAIPRLLGFYPKDSLVAIALRERRHVVVTVRTDLDDPDQMDSAIAVMEREQADQVILVAYVDVVQPEITSTIDRVLDGFARAGIEVMESLRVGSDRWWSYTCASGCCPPEGTPILPATEPGGASRVAAEAAFAGLGALPDREALEATLDPVGIPERQAMDRAFAQVEVEILEQLDEGLNIRDLLAQGVDLVRELHIRYGAGSNGPQASLEEMAHVLTLLDNTEFRDDCIQTSLTDVTASIALWSQMVRWAPPPHRVTPVATLLALVAWVGGAHGALANIALERALAWDPDYRLAKMLEAALSSGANPEPFRQTLFEGGDK